MEEQFVKLLLNRETGTRDKYLVALRATADHYGWTQEFPIWTPKPSYTQGGREYFLMPSTRGELRCQGSKAIYISESPSKHSFAKGQVHRFQISWNCGLLDIAEIAHFTQREWHWMTNPDGQRIDKAHWERRYQNQTTRRARGLVSV